MLPNETHHDLNEQDDSVWLYRDIFYGMQIYGYLGEDTEFVLPEKLGGKNVCDVEPLTFSPYNPAYNEERQAFFREKLASVTVHGYNIGRLAFAGCQNLTLHGIEKWTKEELLLCAPDCPKVLTFERQEGDKGVFRGQGQNPKIRDVFVVSGEYHTVSAGALIGKDYEIIYICEGVERIETGAFSDMWCLKRIVLPSTLKYISPTAFSNCPALPGEMLPECIRTRGKQKYTASLIYHREETSDGSSYKITDDRVVPLHSDSLAEKLSVSDLYLLELTDTTATLYLKYTGQTVTIEENEPTKITARVYDSGGIIEGSRYYDCDDLYEYTFTLTDIQKA